MIYICLQFHFKNSFWQTRRILQQHIEATVEATWCIYGRLQVCCRRNFDICWFHVLGNLGPYVPIRDGFHHNLQFSHLSVGHIVYDIDSIWHRWSNRIVYYESSKDDSMFAEFKNLLAFKANFEALPNVAAYIKSDRFMAGPCNNKMAKWGGDAELKRSW